MRASFFGAPKKRRPSDKRSPHLSKEHENAESAHTRTLSRNIVMPAARKRKSVPTKPAIVMIDALPEMQSVPAAKRSRTASSSHLACAGLFACEQAVPLRTFLFDPTASGPAGQQASLERQGWVGTTRERVALVCPFDDCRGFVMEFVAASAALGAATYQKRLCEHQFAANRACGSKGSKWMLHCGKGATATNKQRPSRCAHGHVYVQAVAAVVAPAAVAASANAVRRVEPQSPTLSGVVDSESESESGSNSDVDFEFEADSAIGTPPPTTATPASSQFAAAPSTCMGQYPNLKAYLAAVCRPAL